VRAARKAGLDPVKINCVLLRGFNEDQVIPFGMFAREEQVVVRFIEFMPLEEDRVWTPQIVLRSMKSSGACRVSAAGEITHERSETARRYRFRDGVGEIGDYCAAVRIRSAATVAGFGLPRRQVADVFIFRVGPRPARVDAARRHGRETAEFIVKVVEKKEERHTLGEPGFVPASRTMVHIGG